KIFACPPCSHGLNVRRGRNSLLWGAHASGVLVSAFRRNQLSFRASFRRVCAPRRFRDGRMPSPARCKRALPRNAVPTLILLPAILRPVDYPFLACAPEFVLALRSVDFFQRSQGE